MNYTIKVGDKFLASQGKEEWLQDSPDGWALYSTSILATIVARMSPTVGQLKYSVIAVENTPYSREIPATTATQKMLERMYISFSNEYITIERYAESLYIPADLAQAMVTEGRLIHETKGCLY